MKIRLLLSLAVVVLLALPGLVIAQGQPPLASHYPAGVEGLKAASLPPPGLYFRDYNYLYFADRFTAGPPNFDLTAYVQAPRLIWISDVKILGGNYGADVLVPFTYQRLKFQGFSDSSFDLADIFVEPITLSWHPSQFDLAIGYGFWAPTGRYSATDPVSPGKNFWTHMLTAGITWYPDAEKTWSLSALSRYEFNQENDDLGLTPGQVLTLEWGLGKSLTKAIEVGAAGYYQQQTTHESGTKASDHLASVVGVGPEIGLVCPYTGVMTSIRWLYETDSTYRPQGNTVNVTFTKRF